MIMLDAARYYQQHGFPVYPLAPNTNTPLISGGHGYLDATMNPNLAAQWWTRSPTANIGLSLANTGIVMLDIDRHENTGADGFDTLKQLASDHRAGELGNGYAETTPRNGLHLFYRLPPGMNLDGKAGTSLFGPNSGVDFTTCGIPIAPDKRPDGQYKRLTGRKIDVIEPAPNWLITELKRVTQATGNNTGALASPTTKKWAGRLLDEMVNGAANGSRNEFLTRIGGKLFWSGADPETVYNMLLVTNDQFLDQPLPTTEINTIYKSLRKREERKWLNA